MAVLPPSRASIRSTRSRTSWCWRRWSASGSPGPTGPRKTSDRTGTRVLPVNVNDRSVVLGRFFWRHSHVRSGEAVRPMVPVRWFQWFPHWVAPPTRTARPGRSWGSDRSFGPKELLNRFSRSLQEMCQPVSEKHWYINRPFSFAPVRPVFFTTRSVRPRPRRPRPSPAYARAVSEVEHEREQAREQIRACEARCVPWLEVDVSNGDGVKGRERREQLVCPKNSETRQGPRGHTSQDTP